MHCNTLNSATEYHFIHKKSNIQFHQLVFLVYRFSETHSIHILLGNFRNFHQPALIPKTMTATWGSIWRPGKAFRVISCATLSELLITTLPDWTQIQPFIKRRMLSIMFSRRRNQYHVLNNRVSIFQNHNTQGSKNLIDVSFDFQNIQLSHHFWLDLGFLTISLV